jgi:PAS domain S-box-containing protein
LAKDSTAGKGEEQANTASEVTAEAGHVWSRRAPGGRVRPAPRDIRRPASISPVRRSRAQSARRYRAIVELAPEATVVTDGDGRITLVNRQTEVLFGYAREELLGQPVDLLAPERFRAAHRQHWTHYMAAPRTRPMGAEQHFVGRRRDGSEFPVEISLSPLPGDGGGMGEVAIVSTIHDISDRLRLEQKRVQQASVLDAVLEAISDGVVISDPDARIVRANRSAQDLLQLWLDMVGQTVDLDNAPDTQVAYYSQRDAQGGLIPPEQWLSIRALRGETVTGESVVDQFYQGPDGGAVQVNGTAAPIRDQEGRIIGAVAVIQDVTARRQLERQVAEQASQLNAIFEAAPDGMAVFDAQGHFLRMNTALRELIGFHTHPEFTTLPLSERMQRLQFFDEQGQQIPVEDWPQWRTLRGEILAGASAIDTRVCTIDGREVWVSTTAAPVRAPDGQITGVVLITREVTARRQLEQRMQEAFRALLAMAQALIGPVRWAEDETGSGMRVVARHLAELTQRVLGCASVGILRLEPDTDVLDPLAVVGTSAQAEQAWRDSYREGPRLSERFGPSSLARLRQDDMVVLPVSPPDGSDGRTIYTKRTWLIAPMSAGGQLVGLLRLDYGPRAHDYTAEELVLAGAVARLGALALECERLFREREEARANELALREVNQRMDEFVAVASHDIRAPVTVIAGALEIALRRVEQLVAAVTGQAAEQITRTAVVELAERVRESIAAADQHADQLRRMVATLFDMEQVRAGTLEVRFQPGDLAALVHEQVEALRIAAPTRMIHLELPGDQPVRIVADADRIGQVVSNYVTNALKYSPEDRPVDVWVEVLAGRVVVSVRDQGPGLPIEEQALVWQMYHRAPGGHAQSGAGSGLGLGLHICKSIVEGHGGHVGVESQVGHGSTFWFDLPLAEPVAEPTAYPGAR